MINHIYKLLIKPLACLHMYSCSVIPPRSNRPRLMQEVKPRVFANAHSGTSCIHLGLLNLEGMTEQKHKFMQAKCFGKGYTIPFKDTFPKYKYLLKASHDLPYI